MPLITLSQCRRFFSDPNYSDESNSEEKELPPSNCQNAVDNCENPNCSNQRCPEQNKIETVGEELCRPLCKTRNAYINFISVFRKDHNDLLPWQVLCQAAACWKNLTEDEKSKYKMDAQNAKYSYKSKCKELNKILKNLKITVACDDIDAKELTKVSRQIQRWKARVLSSVKRMDKCK